jgi:hypothetical protein
MASNECGCDAVAIRESAIPRLVLNIGQVRRKKGARRKKEEKK